MRRAVPLVFPLLVAVLVTIPAPAAAFDNNASAGKSCAACHSLTPAEAGAILHGMVDNVAGVVPGPFQGTWEVDVSVGGRIFPVYVDYSKRFLFQGQFLRLSDKENLTRARASELNRVDVSSIPLADAILIGNRTSKRRILVLTDPSCPYCRKLHQAMKEAVALDPGAAFYVMPYPRNPDDKAVYEASLAAVCDKTGKLLDDAFAGRKLPPPACRSDAVNETIRLAAKLQIPGTPSLILPDGRIVSGYMEPEELLKLLR